MDNFVELENEYLKVLLHPKGAELIKIIGKQDKINYMWKRDPKQWSSSGPILFPIVGAVLNDEYRYQGNTYHMTQHGFARHLVFDTNIISNNQVEFILEADDLTKDQYPFDFVLKVTYKLLNNKLVCNMQVVNPGNDEIFFQIGGHPAFACPFFENDSSNDYYIEFAEFETLNRKVISIEPKGMSHEIRPLFDNERRFFIRQVLFNDDAIVVKNCKSKMVSIKSINHNKVLNFYFENFNHLGIWAAKHVGDLIALEPWVGHIDYLDFTGDFTEKEGIVRLNGKENFSCEFAVEIFQ